jgi:outer membrane protein assembly factor BamB
MAGLCAQQVVCLRPEGTLAWSSGPQERFGLGPFLIADGKLFVLNDDGVLTMARADAEAWSLLGRARLLSGQDAWAPLALAAGRLLLRDSKQMVCVDLTPRGAS